MRWLIRLVSVVLMLALLAVVAVWLIPAKKVAEIAAAQFEARTGRSLTIGGSVVPKVWPVLGVAAEDVTIGNAPWSGEGPMLRAARMEIGLDAAAMIRGEVQVTALVIEAPRIVLERSAEGDANWEFGPPALAPGGSALDASAPGSSAGDGAPKASPGLPPISLARLEVTEGSLVWIDHSAGTRTELSGIALETAVPDLEGPVALDLSAVLNGQPFALTARVPSLRPAVEGQVGGLIFGLTAGAARVAFDGRAGLAPLAAEGKVDADLADLKSLSTLAGIAAPDLPQGLGRSSLTLAGQMTLTPSGSLHLRGATVGLDANRIGLDADVTPGAPRPRIVASVTAGRLDLSALSGGESGGGGGGGTGGGSGGGKAGGWPETPIDASALGAADLDLSLSADALDLGLLTLAPVRAHIVVDKARAVVDLGQAGAYGGTISGQVVANARDGFSTRANLALQDMDMQALLREFAGYERLLARGTLRFNLLGSGGTVAALMKSLSGEGSLALGQGEFRGLDIAGMLMTLDPSYVGPEDKTIFEKITASFTVDKGVLSNDDLKFQAPLVSATGSGTVDIGRQRLDYRIRPVAMANTDGTGGLMVPLIIKGPWSSPDLKLDVEAIAEEQLAEERAELEQRAKEELAKKAAEELGVEIDPNLSAKEARRAARKALEEKAKEEAAKALQDLLGGN